MKLKIIGFVRGEGYTKVLHELEVEPTMEDSWLFLAIEPEEAERAVVVEGKIKVPTDSEKVDMVRYCRVFFYHRGGNVLIRTFESKRSMAENKPQRQVVIHLRDGQVDQG